MIALTMNRYSGLQHTLKDCQAHDNFHGEFNLSVFNPLVIVCCSCNSVRPVAIEVSHIDVASFLEQIILKQVFWNTASENQR